MTRPSTTVIVCLCLVLAGCGGTVAPGDSPDTATRTVTDAQATPDTPATDATAADAQATATQASSETDRSELGVEDGVSATAELNVTPGDGLTGDELEVVVDRTIARVELIRQLEFTGSIDLRVISRAEYRERSLGGTPPARVERLREQQHEAMFLVGENESVAETYAGLYGGSVTGSYSPATDTLVIVSDTAAPTVDTRTLAHELVHALQDQQFGWGRADGPDDRAALNGLREGDATYVDTLYGERCEAEWSCLPTPESSDTADEYNPGLLAVVTQPYVDGAQFVHELRQRGGWDAVNAAYDDPPTTTEQTIHPDAYPNETAVAVDVPDRSGDEWGPIVGVGDRTVGELGVYATLLSTGVASLDDHNTTDGPYSSRNYSHPASEGWAGDSLVAYTDTEQDGYVWKLRWDSPADARAFAAAYRDGLGRQGAQSVDNDTYVIPEGRFADAFRIERDGDTVVVTNAPTVSDLEQIRSRE